MYPGVIVSLIVFTTQYGIGLPPYLANIALRAEISF
jgi:hypothetical protein